MKNKIVIEIASAPGCANCARAKEVIKNLLQNEKDVKIREVDVAQNPEFVLKYRIMSTPAIVINGRLEFTGVPNPEELSDKVNEVRRKK